MTTIHDLGEVTATEHNARTACRYVNESQAGAVVTIECVRCGFTGTGGTWSKAYATYLGEDVWTETGYLPMVKP